MTSTWIHASLPLLLGGVLSAHAQQGGSDWLGSDAAREFRSRVAQLALIYGDSRGIDPRGLLVTGRRIGDTDADCADVAIVVLAASTEVLREQQRACRHASPAPDQPHRKISSNALRQALAARFPLDFSVPGLVSARVDVGRLLLIPARQRIGATLQAQITDAATRRVVPCDIDLTFAVRYEASDQTLRAHHVDITALRSPALPTETAQAWQALLDGTVRSAVDEVILHRFTRDELGLVDVLGLRPDRITVEDDGVEIWFANKSDR